MKTKNKFDCPSKLTKIHFKFTKQRNNLKVNDFIEDYIIDNSLWSEETPLIKKIKYIIFNLLTEQERNIILFYSETQKQETVAKALGVSTATVNKTINIIREKIKHYLRYGNTNTK